MSGRTGHSESLVVEWHSIAACSRAVRKSYGQTELEKKSFRTFVPAIEGFVCDRLGGRSWAWHSSASVLEFESVSSVPASFSGPFCRR